jgi:two-component system OmpR family response regulator
MRVLVAEDDAGLRSVLERALQRAGYVVDAVADGERALEHLRSYPYEVSVIDWRMPRLTGVDVVRRFRDLDGMTPVLLLTARDATGDRVEGLDAGADDYLVKPFEIAELLARLRALQRRPAVAIGPVLQVGPITFDPATRMARSGEEPLPLTAREQAVLEILMRRHPSLVSRQAIAVHAWPDEADALGSNTVAVHIARLRAKLAGLAVEIETVRGMGYRLACRP